MRLRLSSPALIGLASGFLALYARLVMATATVRTVGPIPAELTRGPVLLALWHQHIFAVPLLAKPNAAHPLVGLMSASRDGQLTKAIAARFGIQAAVGSSSKGGMQGARHLMRLARAGHSLFLTPDGPRGPARVAKNGATELSRLTGLPLIPCALVAATPKIAFPSWDNFWLPLPFATLTLRYGPPLPPRTTAAKLGDAINALLDKTSSLT